MTVRELIEVLKTHPGDLRVVVNGYEEGFDDLSPWQISLVRIALDTGVEDYEGRHGESVEGWRARHGESADATGERAERPRVVDALLLRRTSH